MNKLMKIYCIVLIILVYTSSAAAFKQVGGLFKCTACHDEYSYNSSWHNKHESRADDKCTECHFLFGGMPVATANCSIECHNTSKWIGKHDSDTEKMCDTCHDPGQCFVSRVVGDKSSRAEILRQFRDDVLSENVTGQVLIDIYYKISPTLSRAINKSPTLKKMSVWIIDTLLPVIEYIVDNND